MTMPMREKIARAILMQDPFGYGMTVTEALGYADAALEALIEPSNAMCDAGEGWNLRCGCPECDHEEWEKVREGFRAMIQAAKDGA